MSSNIDLFSLFNPLLFQTVISSRPFKKHSPNANGFVQRKSQNEFIFKNTSVSCFRPSIKHIRLKTTCNLKQRNVCRMLYLSHGWFWFQRSKTEFVCLNEISLTIKLSVFFVVVSFSFWYHLMIYDCEVH